MPRLPGFPERPHYNSVKLYLSELAKDIAEMVVDPVKMERFREQLKAYAKLWNEWKTAEEAGQKGFWKPEMGRPECILNVFSRSYNPLKEPQKEAKRLAGSYALCALIHDSQLPHLDKIDTDIIPTEAVEETLSAPRHMLEDRIVGNWNSGPDVREIYVIEVFFNRVNVDLRELCKSVENKSKLKSIEQEIQQANKLSDIEFLELTAEKFEERTKKILSKDETWHDLDRSLKGWFDSVIGRLEKLGFKDKAGLLKYFYKNLLHFAEGISIRSFRGFPDSSIVASARKNASELAEKFKDLAQGAKISLEDAKAEIPVLSKENEFGTIVELLRKDYRFENEDNLKQEIAKVSQDFINRGLYNSTVCIGKQLQVHFDHLENLFNYIIESLKKDFADIPLSNFKEKLFTIVDEEYKKLIPLAYSHLIQAGLAQKNTLKGIEQQVNKKREKTKQAIETKFAILEKQKATPTAPPDSIFGDTWTICGIPINAKKLFKSHPVIFYVILSGIIFFAVEGFTGGFFMKKLNNNIISPLIHVIRLATQDVKLCFAATESSELAIIGAKDEAIKDLKLDLILKNKGKDTVYNAILKLFYSTNLGVSVHTGKTTTSYLTKLNSGKIENSTSLGDVPPRNKDMSLDNSLNTLNISIKIHKAFYFSDTIKRVEIVAQIVAEDYSGEPMNLCIKMGTRETFGNYRGNIFKIEGNELVEYQK